MSISARRTAPEVFYSAADVPRVARGDLADLAREAESTPRKRARLCTHRDPADALHEMFIVHPRNAYVRPHKHVAKPESMSVLEGEVDLVLFDDDGEVREAIAMGTLSSGRPFYYRADEPIYHTILIRSDWLTFHEVTSGPFRREDTEFAEWSPEESDPAAVQRFITELEARVDEWRSRAGVSR